MAESVRKSLYMYVKLHGSESGAKTNPELLYLPHAIHILLVVANEAAWAMVVFDNVEITGTRKAEPFGCIYQFIFQHRLGRSIVEDDRLGRMLSARQQRLVEFGEVQVLGNLHF